jgi:hypothetical protein
VVEIIRTIWKDKSRYIGEVILYSKDGSRRLGSWGFRSKSGRERALKKAKAREKQIMAIKHAKE